MKKSNSSIKSSIITAILSTIFSCNLNGMNIPIERPVPHRTSTAIIVEDRPHKYTARSVSEHILDYIIPERSPPVNPIKQECDGIINFLTSNNQPLFDIMMHEESSRGFSINLSASETTAGMIDDDSIIQYLNHHLIETIIPNRGIRDQSFRLGTNTIFTSVELDVYDDLAGIMATLHHKSVPHLSNIIQIFSDAFREMQYANRICIAIKQHTNSLDTDIFLTDLSCDNFNIITLAKYNSILSDLQMSPLYFHIQKNKCILGATSTFLNLFTYEEINAVYDLLYDDIQLCFREASKPGKAHIIGRQIYRYFKTPFDVTSFITFMVYQTSNDKQCIRSLLRTAIYELCADYMDTDVAIKLSLSNHQNKYIISLE